MKLKRFFTILILLGSIFASFSATFAQDPAAPQQTGSNAESMGENDRLPFMQNDSANADADPSSGSLIFKTFGAMFLIIGLLFFGAWGVKKYGLFGVLKKSADDSVELRVSSSVSVGNGQTISVVRFGERILLVGSTPQSFTLLADEIGGEIASGNLQPKSVSDLLAEENANFGKELNFA